MRRVALVGGVLLPLGLLVGLLAARGGALILITSTPTSACNAETDPATGVTSTSATLNGMLGAAASGVGVEALSEEGADAASCGHWFFDYGPTIDYGTTTPPGAQLTGGPVPVSAVVTGLTPDTTYHFRLRAETGDANIGGDLTFHTLPAPSPGPNPTAALGLTNTVSPATATAGGNAVFSIVVTNHGPADAGDTVVTDAIPVGVAYASATSSVGSCAGGATVTCTVGVLPSGASAAIAITVTAASAGVYTDTVRVDSPDAASPQTTASAALTVTAPPPPPTTSTPPTTTAATTTSPGPPSVVPDASIGGISIGEDEQGVEQALGQPDSTLTLETGKLARYRFHGGLFLVEFDANGHVVSLETYSPFFRTADGVGPGASLTLAAALPGFHQDPCELGYWNGSAATKPTSIVTAFTPDGGLIASVIVTVFSYYAECQGGGRAAPPAITMSLDRSIDGVSIGMTEAGVVKLFGKPQGSLAISLGGGLSGTSVRYRVHGAAFLITYDQHGRVVSLQAYSPYFRTAGNLGPGAALLSVQRLKGFRQDTCEFGFWNWRPGFSPTHVITVFTPNGGLVASVLITQLRLYTACDAGSTELPPS
jgi:uncharacterized repeat protein (TIGR01451 family)